MYTQGNFGSDMRAREDDRIAIIRIRIDFFNLLAVGIIGENEAAARPSPGCVHTHTSLVCAHTQKRGEASPSAVGSRSGRKARRAAAAEREKRERRLAEKQPLNKKEERKLSFLLSSWRLPEERQERRHSADCRVRPPASGLPAARAGARRN